MRCLGPAVVLAAIAVIAAPGGAEAGKKRKRPPAGERVRIETEPLGATVYIGDKDSGPSGVTPLDLTLPVGEAVVIVELDGYVPRYETINVEETGTTQTFAYELTPATAVLRVEAAAGATLPDGTRLVLDGEDQGELPARVDVEVGAHQVQVIAPDRQAYEEWVEVDGGEEHLVTISAAALGATIDMPKPKHHAHGPRKDQPLGEARAGVEIGFRRFRYDEPRSATARPYDARGTLHFVIDAELYPWRRYFPNRVLDHFSITAGAGYSPVIEASDDMGTRIDAYWRSQHAGVRFHWQAKPRVGLDLDAGWQHTLYTFLTPAGDYVAEAPDVDYHSVRLGARVVGRLGPTGAVRLWLGAANQLVVSGGALETRFAGAKVDGVAARAGASAWFLHDHLEARVEGDYAHYSWTFDTAAGAMFDADGGSDSIYGVTLSVGGAY